MPFMGPDLEINSILFYSIQLALVITLDYYSPYYQSTGDTVHTTCHPSHLCLSNIHPLSSKSYLQKLTLIPVIHAKSGNISNKSQ